MAANGWLVPPPPIRISSHWDDGPTLGRPADLHLYSVYSTDAHEEQIPYTGTLEMACPTDPEAIYPHYVTVDNATEVMISNLTFFRYTGDHPGYALYEISSFGFPVRRRS